MTAASETIPIEQAWASPLQVEGWCEVAALTPRAEDGTRILYLYARQTMMETEAAVELARRVERSGQITAALWKYAGPVSLGY